MISPPPLAVPLSALFYLHVKHALYSTVGIICIYTEERAGQNHFIPSPLFSVVVDRIFFFFFVSRFSVNRPSRAVLIASVSGQPTRIAFLSFWFGLCCCFSCYFTKIHLKRPQACRRCRGSFAYPAKHARGGNYSGRVYDGVHHGGFC